MLCPFEGLWSNGPYDRSDQPSYRMQSEELAVRLVARNSIVRLRDKFGREITNKVHHLKPDLCDSLDSNFCP